MKNKLLSYLIRTSGTICLWLIAFPALVSAAQVTLQWDANNPAPDGYRLFRRAAGSAYDYSAHVWSGTATTCTTDLTAGVTYYFVVRAFQGAIESGDSNEVSYTAAVSTGTDADGDGMPDSWETIYGLNPSVNDSAGDLDGDGISNIEEFLAGTDPSRFEANAPSTRPVLSQPANGAHAVSLTPTLTAEAFADADSAAHARTCYQISTNSDFTSLVFERIFTHNLTSFRVPELILDPETVYYWRVRFYDQSNNASEWSLPFSFETLDHIAAGDANGNGIIDAQEIDAASDLDHDGTADVLQSGLQAVVTGDALISKVAVKRADMDLQMLCIQSLDVAKLPAAANQPRYLSSLISFKLRLLNNVTSAHVTVYFSQAAPSGAKWYKLDPDEGWIEFTAAVFSADRKSVTLTLEDGGAGDQDGIRNGIIVDPSGLGYSSQTSGGSSVPPVSDAGGGGGCFIDSVRSEKIQANAAVGLVIVLALLLSFRRGRHVQLRKKRN